jgi:hypothetical protein
MLPLHTPFNPEPLPAPPLQAMHGILFDASEGIPPAASVILRSVNLRRPGPLVSPRLWAALHDAVMYSDPRTASGGKVRACPCTRTLVGGSCESTPCSSL